MQTRWAPSLGQLDGTHQIAWGTTDYKSRYEPTCFFGLYDLRDYIALWRHKGEAWVLWAGSDITNLKNGFVFNDGKLKWLSKLLRGNWWVFPIIKKAKHWVENAKEGKVLEEMGIRIAGICPSFLGDKRSYPISFVPNKKFFVSCGRGRQIEYGFQTIENIAGELPWITFVLYGDEWETKHENVIVRGRVTNKEFNEEIKEMHGSIRLNDFDGASEIMVKSVLMGQYPIAKVGHPLVDGYENELDLILKINQLSKETKPNVVARNYYLRILNDYPWSKEYYES